MRVGGSQKVQEVGMYLNEMMMKKICVWYCLSSHFIYTNHTLLVPVQPILAKSVLEHKWHQDHTLFNYNKHTESIEHVYDMQHQFNRKISFSLLLNDDYEGGELQILKHPSGLTKVPKKAGTLVIFDSNCYHRVTPVKKGRRDVLVGWVIGPRWR